MLTYAAAPNRFNISKKQIAISKKQIVAFTLLTLVSGVAMAGTTGSEFLALYTLLTGWASGYLGKALAIAAFITGAILGFAKGTAMPALIGIVFAIIFSIGPGVIDTMLAATI